MEDKTIKVFFVVLAMVLGGYVTYLDIENIRYVLGGSGFLLAALIAKISYRNKNYLGMFFTSFKAMSYSLNNSERNIGIFLLSFLASPFIFMLIMSAYGKITL